MSQQVATFNKRSLNSRPFGEDGCPVRLNNNKPCGETRGLDIIMEFHKLYEDKLRQIDVSAGGDGLKAKLELQQAWINDLTEQNRMLAIAVEELELEAIDRVQMLEEKLQNSARSLCEVMKRYRDYENNINIGEPFQTMFYLENDLANILEFLRRVRDDHTWSIEGLKFYDVTFKDLFGQDAELVPAPCSVDEEGCPINSFEEKRKDEGKLDEKDRVIRELQERLESVRTTEVEEELRNKKQEYEELQQSMLDMREALTEEVANKHDIISLLRRDVYQLEERCLTADKQTAFKDDIIKELRKEIKKLKQEECEEVTKFLTNENRALLDKKNYMETELLKANANLVELRIESNKDSTENSTSEKNHSYLRHLEIENVILKRHITVKDELLIKQITIIKCLTGKLLQLEAYYNRLEGMAEKYEKKDVGVITCPVGICTRGVNCKMESKSEKKRLCATCSIDRCEQDETRKYERPCDVCSIGRCDLDGLDLEPGDSSGVCHDNVQGEPAGTPKDLDRMWKEDKIDKEENKVKCPCEVVQEEGEDLSYKCDTCDCYVKSPKVCPFGVCSVCRCPIPPADDGDDNCGFRGTAVMVNKEVSCPVKVGNTGTNTTVQPMAYRDLGTGTTKDVGRQTGVRSSCPVGCSCCICTADELVAGCVGPNQDGGDIETLMKGGIRGKTDPSQSVAPESTVPVGQEGREESISPRTVDASARGTIDNMQYSNRQDGTNADTSQSTRGIIDTRQLGTYPDAMVSKVPGTCPDVCDGICRNAVQTSYRPPGEIGALQSIPPGIANADMRGTIDTRQYGMYPDAMVSNVQGTCPDICDGICRNAVHTSYRPPGEIGAFQSFPPGIANADMRGTVDTRQYGMYPDAMVSNVQGTCPDICDGICRNAVQTNYPLPGQIGAFQSIPPGTANADMRGTVDTRQYGMYPDAMVSNVRPPGEIGAFQFIPPGTANADMRGTIDTRQYGMYPDAMVSNVQGTCPDICDGICRNAVQTSYRPPGEIGAFQSILPGTPNAVQTGDQPRRVTDPFQSIPPKTVQDDPHSDPPQSVEGTTDTKEGGTRSDPSQTVEENIDTKEDSTQANPSQPVKGTIDTKEDDTRSDPSQSVELNIDMIEDSTQADPSQSVEVTIDTKGYSTQADPSQSVAGTIDTKGYSTQADPSQSVAGTIDTKADDTHVELSQLKTRTIPSQSVEGTIDTKADDTRVELPQLKTRTIDTRQDGTDAPVICRDTCDEACQQPVISGRQAVGEMDPSLSISPGKYREPGAPESVAPSVQERTDSKKESAVMQYSAAQGTEICNTCPLINIVCSKEPGASRALAENVQGRTKSYEEEQRTETEKNQVQQEQAKIDSATCNTCPPTVCPTDYPKIDSVVVQYAVAPPVNIAFPNDGKYYTPGPVYPKIDNVAGQQQGRAGTDLCHVCPPQPCPPGFMGAGITFGQQTGMTGAGIYETGTFRPGMLGQPTGGMTGPGMYETGAFRPGMLRQPTGGMIGPGMYETGAFRPGMLRQPTGGMTYAGMYETGAFRPGRLALQTDTTGAGIYETGAFGPGMLRQPTGTTGAGIYETGAFGPGMLMQPTGTTGAGIYETGTFLPGMTPNAILLEGVCPDRICINSCICAMLEDQDTSSEDYQLYGGPKKTADTRKKTLPPGSPCRDCKDPCRILAEKVCGEDKITQEPEDDGCGHHEGRRDSQCDKCVANTCSPSKGTDCHKSAVTIIEPTTSSLVISTRESWTSTLEPCPVDICKSEMCIPVRCRDPDAPGEGGAACKFCQEECEDIMEEISVLTETEESGTRKISIVSQEACGMCVKETCKTGRVCCKNRGKSLLTQKESCGLCLVSEPILSEDIYGRDKGATKIAISCKICRLPCKSSCGDSTVLESKSEMGLYVVCRTCTGAIITDDPTNPSEQICSCVECTTAKEIHSTKEVMDVREQSSNNYATAPCGSSGDETHQHTHPTYPVVTNTVQSSPELDHSRPPPSGASISTQPSFCLKATGNSEDLTVKITVEESTEHDLVVPAKKYRSDVESPSTKTCSLEFSTCSSQTLSGDHASGVRSSSGSLSKEKEYAGLSRKEFECDHDEKNGNDARELTHRDEINLSELKLTIAELKNKLLDAEDKIDDLKSIHMIDAKDNNKALMQMYSNEIEELRKELKQAAQEKEDQAYLKERIKLLETSKGNSDHITTNLNTAVDLYINTIGVLEAAEEKSKLEMEQQRITISNLQEALIVTKQELEKLKAQSHQDMEELLWFNKQLYFDITDLKQNNDVYHEQIKKNRSYFEKLVEFNFDLEVQHVNSLQDVSMLETKIYDCKNIFKSYEDEQNGMKVQIKKLYKKNRCYEEIVNFFKSEMAVMSDELLTLQEVLNLTNVTTQEENNKLMNAIFQLRRINDRLVGHLCEIEKQMVLENQVNQINESRINELQQIISTKNHDLNQHDEVLRDLRRKLSNAANQNAELRKTICSLNENVATMKHDLTKAQDDQHQTKEEVKEVESQMSLANDNLEVKGHLTQKKRKIAELEKNLKNREESLAATEKELQTFKDKQMEKLSTSKELINSLKEQLAHSEMKNKQMAGDYQEVARQLQDFSNIDKAKHYELSHYKSLVDEMKQSLMQMNVNLVRCEATNIHFLEELGDENEFVSCPTIANVFAELKQSMVHMRSRLSQADVKNTALEEECSKTNAKCSEIEEIQEKKERDYLETQKKLEKRVKMAVEEQSRLTELVEQQKRQLDKLNKELQNKNDQEGFENAKSLIEQVKHEKIPQMCSHGEASSLKCELNKSLQRQVLLNDENEKLHNQLLNLRTKLTMVEQDNDGLKRQSDEFNVQLKRATKEKEYLTIKNQELSKTLVQLRCTHNSMEKQCRYYSDSVSNLEMELVEMRNERDDISADTQHLVHVIRLWMNEQSNVNCQIQGKFQNYTDVIASLEQTLMEQLSHEECWSIHQQKFLQRQQVKEPAKQTPPSYYEQSPNVLPKKSPAKFQPAYLDPRNCRYVTSPRQKPYYRSEDGRPHSSSTSSKYVREYSYDSASSPCSTRSPSPHSLVSWSDIVDGTDPALLCDWFSPNFRENDTDENDDDSFVNKVQIMTAQVQEANKRWQKKMNKEIANVTHGIK